MASLNSITIVGNSGSDAEMRYTPQGTPITSFNVAVNDPRLVNNEWKDNTEWFRIICFNKLAERVNEKVLKGMPVLVMGKLKLNRWQDKNTGEMKASLEILASKVVSFAKSPKSAEPVDDIEPEGDIEPDEIPF
ncbi:MAG: single-stranded DNA-binding protein [Patescibacteria group bacterium]|jgi:single-strand DNA-binding protein